MTRTEQDAYLLNARTCLANEAEARACGNHNLAVKLYRRAQSWRVAANAGATEAERKDALEYLADQRIR